MESWNFWQQIQFGKCLKYVFRYISEIDIIISNEARELRCVSFDATVQKGPAHGRLAIYSTCQHLHGNRMGCLQDSSKLYPNIS